LNHSSWKEQHSISPASLTSQNTDTKKKKKNHSFPLISFPFTSSISIQTWWQPFRPISSSSSRTSSFASTWIPMAASRSWSSLRFYVLLASNLQVINFMFCYQTWMLMEMVMLSLMSWSVLYCLIWMKKYWSTRSSCWRFFDHLTGMAMDSLLLLSLQDQWLKWDTLWRIVSYQIWWERLTPMETVFWVLMSLQTSWQNLLLIFLASKFHRAWSMMGMVLLIHGHGRGGDLQYPLMCH